MFVEIPVHSKSDKRGAKRSLVFGVGINDAGYQTSIVVNGRRYVCPYYEKWLFMLSRSYSKSWHKKHPTYVGCSVSKEWHSFMTFKVWMESQNWKGKQLDKDLLSLANKRYSPETCLFVTPRVNSLFNERAASQGRYPLGVYARNGKYEVGVSEGKAKRVWVGSYKTVPEAIDAYLLAKKKVVDLVVANEPNKEVKTAIENYWVYFADKCSLLKAGY